MKDNILVNLSKQFAIDVINICAKVDDFKKGNVLVTNFYAAEQASEQIFMKAITHRAGLLLSASFR